MSSGGTTFSRISAEQKGFDKDKMDKFLQQGNRAANIKNISGEGTFEGLKPKEETERYSLKRGARSAVEQTGLVDFGQDYVDRLASMFQNRYSQIRQRKLQPGRDQVTFGR